MQENIIFIALHLFLLIESTYFKNLKEKSCQADRALLTKTDLKNNSYCDSYPIRGR